MSAQSPHDLCDFCPDQKECLPRAESLESWIFSDQKEHCEATGTPDFLPDDTWLSMLGCWKGGWEHNEREYNDRELEAGVDLCC